MTTTSFDLTQYRQLYDSYQKTEEQRTSIQHRTHGITMTVVLFGAIFTTIGLMLATNTDQSSTMATFWTVCTILIATMTVIILMINTIARNRVMRHIRSTAHHDNIPAMTQMVAAALHERYALRNVEITEPLEFHGLLIDTIHDSMDAPMISVLTDGYVLREHLVRIIDGQPTLIAYPEAPQHHSTERLNSYDKHDNRHIKIPDV